jgi:hypothetical protein
MGDRPHAVRAVVLLASAVFVSIVGAASAAAVGPAGDTWSPYDGYDSPAAAYVGLRHSHTATLTLAGRSGPVVVHDDGSGAVAVEGAEPMFPGERLSFTWTALGKDPHLRVVVADPLRHARVVRIPLRPADHATTVSVAASGALTIVRGADTTVSPEPALTVGEPGGPPPAPWIARTPQKAVTRAISTLRDPASPSSRARYCAALDPLVSATYAEYVRDDWAVTPFVPTCALGFAAEMDENINSSPGRTTGSILSTKILSPTRAVVRTRLHNRYASGQKSIRRTVDVLVVRARASLPWRIADETALVPPFDPAAPDEGAPGLATAKELLRSYRQYVADVAEGRTYQRAERRRAAKATVPVAAAAVSCPAGTGTTMSDGLGDALVGDRDPTRDPALIAADVVSARLSSSAVGRCLTIRFAKPPPARYHVTVWTPARYVSVWVAAGHALLVRAGEYDWNDPDGEVTYYPGLVASLTGADLVLRIPAKALPAPSSPSRWHIRVDAPHPYAQSLQDSVPNAKADQ